SARHSTYRRPRTARIEVARTTTPPAQAKPHVSVALAYQTTSNFGLDGPALSRAVAVQLPAVDTVEGLDNLLSRRSAPLARPRCRSARSCGCRCRHSDASSGAEEVVVDVLLPLVAEEGDDVPEARVPRSQLAGSDKVRAGARAHEQPELAGQAAHLADRRVAVHRDYLVDDLPVPGEDAGDEAVGDALDQVPADLAAHQDARLVRLYGDHLAG